MRKLGIGSQRYLELAVQRIPTDKILFGSLAPELDTRVAIHSVRLLKISEQDKAMMLGGNIERLLGIGTS